MSHDVQAMFPTLNQPRSFSEFPTMLSVLQDLRVNDDILERLQTIGVVSPCHVMNSFGLSEARIMETFLHLGYHLLIESKTKEACQILVMFGRSQTLRTRMNAEPNMDWTP